MNYNLASKYFEKVDETINYGFYGGMVVIGVILMLLASFGVPSLILLGMLFVLAAVILLICRKAQIKSEKAGIPSDAMYDQAVATHLQGLQERALNKLGLDSSEVEEIKPLVFSSYTYKGATKHKIGQDNKSRTNRYEAVMLFFLQDEVHCYTYRFYTTMNKKTETTDVYFYSDIVSATTSSEETKIDKETFNYEYFELCTSGGTKLTVSLKDVDHAQETINAMRSMLRERKRRT